MTAILEPQTTTQPVDTAPEPPLRRAPAPEPVAPAQTRPVPAVVAEPPVRTKRVLTPAGVRILGAVLLALYALGVAVQPPADGPQPVVPGWVNVLYTVISVGLIAVLAGVLTGRRWSVWAGLATGISLLTLSVSCPLDGHHEIAAWWFVQMAVGVVMTVLPALALRRPQATSSAG
jgi:hypothetical protein